MTASEDDVAVLLRQQDVLAQFGELALRSNDLDEILSEACSLVGKALGTDLAKVMELQADRITLVVRAGTGWKDGVVGVATVKAEKGSSEGYALQTGAPVASSNVDEEHRFKYAAFIKDNGVKALVNVAIAGSPTPFGILQVDSRTPRVFGDREINFLRGYANLLAAAVARLKAAEELRLTQDVLQAREAALAQSNKLEAIGQLTGGVAHDFNNLLTIIRSSVDFLRRSDLPEDRRLRYVGAISETVDRASKLTMQLLAFARRQALHPEVFDVGRRLQDVVGLLSSFLGSRIRIEQHLCDPACFALADPNQFETALVNLAVNARDAMDGEGHLKFSLSRVSGMPAIRGHVAAAGDFVAISVSDNGCGIAPDQIDKIFEPFFTTKDVGRGTGLGLSQVFGFAKQSHGEVHVESVLGEGATFTLYLPHSSAEAAQLTRAHAADPSPPGEGLVILVVEDNEAVGQFSTEMLRDLSYRTVWAANGREALEALSSKRERFDLVFSDVVMPGMGGVELAETIRRLHPGLPVVLTSGYSDVLAQEGSHGFELVQKPYSVEALAVVLRHALTSAPTRGSKN